MKDGQRGASGVPENTREGLLGRTTAPEPLSLRARILLLVIGHTSLFGGVWALASLPLPEDWQLALCLGGPMVHLLCWLVVGNDYSAANAQKARQTTIGIVVSMLICLVSVDILLPHTTNVRLYESIVGAFMVLYLFFLVRDWNRRRK